MFFQTNSGDELACRDVVAARKAKQHPTPNSTTISNRRMRGNLGARKEGELWCMRILRYNWNSVRPNRQRTSVPSGNSQVTIRILDVEMLSQSAETVPTHGGHTPGAALATTFTSSKPSQVHRRPRSSSWTIKRQSSPFDMRSSPSHMRRPSMGIDTFSTSYDTTTTSHSLHKKVASSERELSSSKRTSLNIRWQLWKSKSGIVFRI